MSRARVKVRGVVVADRTFGCGNDAQAWEVDRKGHVAADLRTAHAPGTVQRVIAFLIALMEFVLDHPYIETNPARIRLNLQRDARLRYVTSDPSELMAVWAEFTALRPRDIVTTGDGGTIVHISRSIVRTRGEGSPTVTSTKSGTDRMIPLTRSTGSQPG